MTDDGLRELFKDAPKFEHMDRGELVAHAYGLFAAGNKAGAENAKLREQGARLFDKTLELGDENAKLRELVKAFWWCTENFDIHNKCDMCPLPQRNNLECECETRIHELGIEV